MRTLVYRGADMTTYVTNILMEKSAAWYNGWGTGDPSGMAPPPMTLKEKNKSWLDADAEKRKRDIAWNYNQLRAANNGDQQAMAYVQDNLRGADGILDPADFGYTSTEQITKELDLAPQLTSILPPPGHVAPAAAAQPPSVGVPPSPAPGAPTTSGLPGGVVPPAAGTVTYPDLADKTPTGTVTYPDLADKTPTGTVTYPDLADKTPAATPTPAVPIAPSSQQAQLDAPIPLPTFLTQSPQQAATPAPEVKTPGQLRNDQKRDLGMNPAFADDQEQQDRSFQEAKKDFDATGNSGYSGSTATIPGTGYKGSAPLAAPVPTPNEKMMAGRKGWEEENRIREQNQAAYAKYNPSGSLERFDPKLKGAVGTNAGLVQTGNYIEPDKMAGGKDAVPGYVNTPGKAALKPLPRLDTGAVLPPGKASAPSRQMFGRLRSGH